MQERGYFGPICHKPRSKSSKPTRKQGHVHTAHVTSLEETTLDPYPEFDTFNDVNVGYFVAMNSNIGDMRLGIHFFLGKVKATVNVSTNSGCMKVIWYWPKPTNLQDDPGMWIHRYRNCLKRKWIPSYEPSNWVDLDTAITSWVPSPKIETCMVEKHIVQKEISIPKAMTFHLLEHMANQSQTTNDVHVDNNAHAIEDNDLE